MQLGQTADDEQLALEVEAVAKVGQVGAAADERLAHDRLAGGGRRPQVAVVGRHVAPAEERLPFGAHKGGEVSFAGGPPGGVARQKEHGHAVVARRRQGEAQPGRLGGEEGVRQLGQNARAVAGVRLRAARAAMAQVLQHRQRVGDDGRRPVALDVGHEAGATGIVLVTGIV